MKSIFERILDLHSAARNDMLPCDRLRLGDRQYDELQAYARRWIHLSDDEPAGVVSLCGMKIERVEAPDYMVIG